MKKYILISLSMLLFSAAMAQPKEDKIEYNKLQVPGYSVEVPVAPSVAEEAIKNRFKNSGAKGKERKGFWEFRNVRIPELRNAPVDAYIKIDKKSRKDNDNSIVSMIVTEPGVEPGASDSLVNAARGDVPAIAAVGAFGLLSSLQTNTEDHGLDLELKKQDDEVKKAEKEYNNLVKDGEDLQNKAKKIQNDLETNRNNITKKAEELKKQKETLLQIQAKRKVAPGDKVN